MPPDDPKAELTWEWLIKAKHDLLAAERTSAPPSLPDVTSFIASKRPRRPSRLISLGMTDPFGAGTSLRS